MEIFGRLDCAVNNAGIEGVLAPTADYPEETWNRCLAST
jgi:NAD(P)-dependent dehydrogenase (short-subunit alcohol dehydrogenase family)